QPRPDTRIVAEVESSRILVRRVPDLRGDLVLLQERLESLLVVRAIENQPARRGIRFTIAEYGVEPPRDLVDEVVHVAGEAAIVVAEEEHATALVDLDPLGVVDRVHP